MNGTKTYHAAQVISAVADEIGGDRVGVRFAPFYVLGAEDDHMYSMFTYVLEELNKKTLAYVHMIEPRKGRQASAFSRQAIPDTSADAFYRICGPKALTNIRMLIRPSAESLLMCSMSLQSVIMELLQLPVPDSCKLCFNDCLPASSGMHAPECRSLDILALVCLF